MGLALVDILNVAADFLKRFSVLFYYTNLGIEELVLPKHIIFWTMAGYNCVIHGPVFIIFDFCCCFFLLSGSMGVWI